MKECYSWPQNHRHYFHHQGKIHFVALPSHATSHYRKYPLDCLRPQMRGGGTPGQDPDKGLILLLYIALFKTRSLPRANKECPPDPPRDRTQTLSFISKTCYHWTAASGQMWQVPWGLETKYERSFKLDFLREAAAHSPLHDEVRGWVNVRAAKCVLLPVLGPGGDASKPLATSLYQGSHSGVAPKQLERAFRGQA